jgi:hypothetical protein
VGFDAGQMDTLGDRTRRAWGKGMLLRLFAPSLLADAKLDLVAGSGLQFEDRGARELKGVPDQWRILAVVDG